MSLEITPAQSQNRPESGQSFALATVSKPQPPPDLDSLLLAYFLMFARCPRTPNPDIDGHFNLGEIGEAPEKTWTKATPYSLARPKL